MAEKRQGENEVEHPRKKNCFAVRKPSLAVADVLRQSGRVAMPQYCKLPTACLRSVAPEAFLSSTSTSIREDSGTKTEASHGEGFISALHRGLLFRLRKNTQVRASLNSRATDGPRLLRGIPRFSCQDLPWGLYYFRLARHSDSEEQLALPSVRFACLLPEATPYGYRAAILRMPCNLDASSSIPISSSAW